MADKKKRRRKSLQFRKNLLQELHAHPVIIHAAHYDGGMRIIIRPEYRTHIEAMTGHAFDQKRHYNRTEVAGLMPVFDAIYVAHVTDPNIGHRDAPRQMMAEHILGGPSRSPAMFTRTSSTVFVRHKNIGRRP